MGRRTSGRGADPERMRRNEVSERARPSSRLRVGTGFVAVLIAAACLSWAVDNGATAKLDELTPATIG